MDITLQTKVTDSNRSQFYNHVYCQQFESKSQLINLEMISSDCVVIDCCGWHYQNLFPNKNIVILETVKTALQFKIDRSKFSKLINDQQDHVIKWPDLEVIDAALVFDRSPMLKYRSIDNLTSLLSAATEKYLASQLIVNLDTTFIDDSRLVDRFYNLSNITIPNFTVIEFAYKAESKKLYMHFKRKHDST